MAIPWLQRTLEIRNSAAEQGRGSDVAMADSIIEKAVAAGLTAEELREAGQAAAANPRKW